MTTGFCLDALRYLPYILVRDEKIVDISYSWEDITGYKRCEVIQKDFLEVLKKLFKSRFSIDNFNNEGEEKLFYIFTKFYEVREIKIITIQGLSANERIYIFLEEQNSRLEEIFPYVNKLCMDNYLGIAIYSVPDLILLKANQIYLEYIYETCDIKEDIIGLSIEEFVDGWNENSAKYFWDSVVNGEKTSHMRGLKCDTKKRGETYWDFSLTPMLDKGRIKYIIVMLVDVTEKMLDRRRIEEQIRVINEQKQIIERNAKTKDEFFSFMYHEFKTPISVINAAIQTMEMVCKNEISDKIGNYIKIIRQNSLRQLRLINNFLDISKAEAGYLKINRINTDIVAITRSISESVMPYANEKGINLKFTTEIPQMIMTIDDEKYERILLNLLSNAIKFTPENKSVDICLFQKESNICIRIKDEGIGIPKEKQSIIFERFGQINSGLTRKSEGTGIGLTLVKILVDALDGEISLESEEGQGSTFVLSLPVIKIQEEERTDLTINYGNHKVINQVTVEFSDIYD